MVSKSASPAPKSFEEALALRDAGRLEEAILCLRPFAAFPSIAYCPFSFHSL